MLFWGRFIDDIFLLWSDSISSFKEFVTSLNVNDVGLKFTYEISYTAIPFLDILIEKDRRGNLQTSIYRKPTATSSLLNWESHHPTSLKRGIPKRQFLRVRRKTVPE